MSLQLWSFHIRDVGVDGLRGLTYSQEQSCTFIKEFMQKTNAEECFYLATCNRVEFLLYSNNELHPAPFAHKPKVFLDTKKILQHLLEVACSMDSVVFGENQIQGQIKNAFTHQQKFNFIGSKLSQILNLILREAKVIRTETPLSRLNTSVSSVVAKMIGETKNKDQKILLVGYGETHKLLHKALEKKNYKNISITNRTFSKIPDQVNVKKISWENFVNNNLESQDVICFATSSEKTLLTKKHLTTTRAKLVLDLCIPQNADKILVESLNSKYIGLEEIQSLLKKDLETATLLRQELEKTIADSVQEIFLDLSLQSINSLITNNIQKTLEVHNSALSEDFFENISNLTSEQKEGLAEWSRKLIKKINHIHLKTYKEVVDVVQNQDWHSQK